MAENMVTLCEILTFLLQGYCLQYFLGSFLDKRLPGRWQNALAVSVCYGVMKMASSHLLPSRLESFRIFYRLVLQCILLLVLAFVFYRAAKVITVFLLTTFFALSEISFFIGYMIMNISTPILELETRFFTLGYIEALPFEQMLRFTAAMLQVLCFVLWVLLLYLSLKKVVSAFREKEYDMNRTELLFILTPGLVGLLLCILLRIIMVTVEDGMPALLYDRYPALRVLIPAILLLSLLSILYSVKLFQDMISLSRERNSRMVLEQQVDSLQEHMGEIERLYAGVRSVKHDMKNTLSVLMRLFAKNGEMENPELTAYLSELNQSFDRLELRFHTGNAVADALLNMKYHESIRCMPELDFQADKLLFPENLVIQSYDIGVILGNALDNAIEACLRFVQENPQVKPFIRLSSFQRGKFFFLEIENSFDGKWKRTAGAEFPVTLKNEKQMHGIGFANMKKTAEKYDGAVDFSVEGNPGGKEDASGFAIFTLSIMMKNGRREDF